MQEHAKQLRRDTTKAESLLWPLLRNRKLNGWKFRRQHAIDIFIVDFCCAELLLILELDGRTHDARTCEDHHRDEFLRQRGYRVVRIWNEDVFDDVMRVVREIANVGREIEGLRLAGNKKTDSPMTATQVGDEATPHPLPLSPEGGEGRGPSK